MQVKLPKDPPFPLLPGVVGPPVETLDRDAPVAAAAEEGFPLPEKPQQRGYQPTITPLPAETWDRAAEQHALVMGRLEPITAPEERDGHPFGVVLGLIATVGVATALVAIGAGQRRARSRTPVSILGTFRDGATQS